jgi:hypothetical protein
MLTFVAGQAGRDRVQLRQEPGGELKCPTVGGEGMPSATDQDSSIRRDSTEHLQHSRAAPSA